MTKPDSFRRIKVIQCVAFYATSFKSNFDLWFFEESFFYLIIINSLSVIGKLVLLLYNKSFNQFLT